MINLVKLIKLTMRRKISDEDYFKFQEYQASHVVNEVIKQFNCNIDMTVIDYGCGKGGYTKILSSRFKKVIAIDYHVVPINWNSNNIEFISSDLLTYKGKPVDVIFCASVIEHIDKSKQPKFIEQIAVNLKQGGYLYLNFPPFNSPIGGHACAPFHYLPDKLAFLLARTIKKYPINSYQTMYGDYGLSKTNINEIITMLQGHGFKLLAIKSRYMPEWYYKMFSLNNLFNWNAEFYCTKL